MAHDGFALDQAGPHRQLCDRCRGEEEAIGEVITSAGAQGDAADVALGEDAKAVVLDLVNPAGPGRWLLGRAGQVKREAL